MIDIPLRVFNLVTPGGRNTQPGKIIRNPMA